MTSYSPVPTTAERAAVTLDARRRLTQLYGVRDQLLLHADDPLVLSELVTIQSEIAAAVKALR